MVTFDEFVRAIDADNKGTFAVVESFVRENKGENNEVAHINDIVVLPGINDSHNTPLYLAYKRGNYQVVDLLLAISNIDLNIQDASGMTVFMEMLEKKGEEHIVRLHEALRHPIDINKADTQGATALHYAAAAGNTYGVTRLLEKFKGVIDINKVTNNGESALLDAVRGGFSQIVSLLKSAGANMQQTDRKGKTLQEIAAKRYNKAKERLSNAERRLKSAQEEYQLAAADKEKMEQMNRVLDVQEKRKSEDENSSKAKQARFFNTPQPRQDAVEQAQNLPAGPAVSNNNNQ